MKHRKKIPTPGRTATMAKFFRALAATAVLYLATGCNPTRRIDMYNQSGDKAEISFVIKEDSILVSPFYLHSSKKTSIELYTVKPYNIAKMSFGVGPWRREFLQDITDDLEAIEIKTATGRQVLSSQEEMNRFLTPRISGLTRRKINIYLE
jgi:hypothetical protein